MDLLTEYRKSPIPKELSFPEAEYTERLKKVRKLMAEEDMDVLLITNTPNKCYLTGYQTVMSHSYSCVIVPREGQLAMHLPEAETACALLTSVIDDLIVFDWYKFKDPGAQLGAILRERGFADKRIGIEMSSEDVWESGAMDVRTYLRLKELLPQAQLQDATNLVLKIRMIKSPAELDYMRKAGELSLKGAKAAIAAAEVGKTDNDMEAAAYYTMIGGGSEILSIDPMILTGYRSGWMPHNMYKRVPLKVGDSLYIEITGTYERYNAPNMRSAVIGYATDTVRRLSDATLHIVNLLLENIKPGRTGHEVAMEARKGFAPVESIAYFHGAFGYSIGLGFPQTWTEAPMYIADGIDRPLEPGMTFHLPICIWVPGKCGLGFSESVAVTETGCEILTPGNDRELVVIPA